MKLLKTNTTEIKKSKFIAILYEIDDFEEIKTILTNLKDEHKKAKHIVYAYKFDPPLAKVMIKNQVVRQELLFIIY